MADGKVTIDTKLDTSGVDKGIKDLKGKLDEAGKSIDNSTKKNKTFAESLKNISTGAVATAAGLAGVATAIKKTVDALDDCAAAYRVQRNAEQALQVAAKNNPYLNNESVESLKAFAGELQKVSDYSDEMSIKIMAQLAATGRNEEQITQIMSAAADMAAVTGQDLATAAEQLNATLNGNAGTLGRQIESINNLTKAELENGKAIELVAAQYKGAAQETANIETQLANAWGDFKENIGRGWDSATAPIKEFFVGLLTDINEATSKLNGIQAAKTAMGSGTETAADVLKLLEAEDAKLKEMYGTQGVLNLGNQLGKVKNEELYNKQLKEQLNIVSSLKARYRELADAEEAAAAAAQEKAEAEKTAAEAADKERELSTYIEQNNQALQESVAAIKARAQATGEEVDAGSMYTAYLNSYITLISKSNGLIDANNEAAKERLALANEWKAKLDEIAASEEKVALSEQKIAEASSALSDAIGTITKYSKGEFAKTKEELRQLYAQFRAVSKASPAALAEIQKNNLIQYTKDELQKGLQDAMYAAAQALNDSIFIAPSEETLNLLDQYKQGLKDIDDLKEQISNEEAFQFMGIVPDSTLFEQLKDQTLQDTLKAITDAAGADMERGVTGIEKVTEAYNKRVETLRELEEVEETLQHIANYYKHGEEYTYVDKYGMYQTDVYQRTGADAEAHNAFPEITGLQAQEALKQIEEARRQAEADLWAGYIDEVNGYAQQVMSIVNDMTSLMLKAVTAEQDAELAAIKKKYDDGEISEEEYYKTQKEIKEKAAREEYKIQMFQWTASLLAATANIAEGVSKAIAQGGTAGLITGALVSAAGAVQLASIIASKPVPPSFATGGVIGGMNGASMGGDNTYIHARNGEMILNAAQQRSLWEMIAGNPSAGDFNLTVNNTQSGRVDTQIRQDQRGYIIDIVDKHVNQGLSDGTYDPGFAAMNTRQEGVRIL